MIMNEARRWVFQRDEYTCRFCGHGGNGVSMEIDHSVPLAQGGTDHGNNLQTTCWACNALKSDRNTHAFERWLKYNFASRKHYARYAAAARSNGRLPDVGRWLSNNPPTVIESLFSGWEIPSAHRSRKTGSFQ